MNIESRPKTKLGSKSQFKFEHFLGQVLEMVKLWEKVLVVGPSGFEIWLEVGRPRVWIENPEGPTAMTFTYKLWFNFVLPSSYSIFVSQFFHQKWKCRCFCRKSVPFVAFVESKLMQRQNYVLKQVICLLIKFHSSLSIFFGSIVISVASLLTSLITFVVRCEHVGIVVSLHCCFNRCCNTKMNT